MTERAKAKRFIVKTIGRHTRAVREYITTVDAEDAHLLRSFVWTIIGAKGARLEADGKAFFYVGRTTANGNEQLHRVIVDARPGEDVYHINGDRLDNRKANLLKSSERVVELED